MNKILLVGRLVREVNSYESKSGLAYARGTIAVNRIPRKNQTGNQADFIPFIVFGSSANFVKQYITKGDLISIEGSLDASSYTNKDGVLTNSFSVIVDNIRSLSRKSDDNSSNNKFEENITISNDVNGFENASKPNVDEPSFAQEEDESPWELDI